MANFSRANLMLIGGRTARITTVVQNNHFAFFKPLANRTNLIAGCCIVYFYYHYRSMFRFARARGPQARESSLSSRVPRAAYTSLVSVGGATNIRTAHDSGAPGLRTRDRISACTHTHRVGETIRQSRLS